MPRPLRSILLVALPAALAFWLGVGVGHDLPLRLLFGKDDAPASVDREIEKLREVYGVIREAYVTEKGNEEVFQGALRGMVSGLDPFSEYFSEEEFEELRIETSGEFPGLGIEVSMEDGRLVVITPIEGTPAYRAGIQPGDWIVEVNRLSTEGWTLGEAVRRLRGPVATEVVVGVRRRGEEAVVQIPIVRDLIRIRCVRGAEVLEGGIGYVRLTSFQDGCAQELAEALAQMREKGMRALVLDIRFNGGGLLSESVAVCDLFLSEGEIVSTRGRNAAEKEAFFANEANTLSALPLVLLVNGGSASASEIVAGAMQDYGRGVLVGSRTYGKGSVQTIFPLSSDGSAVKLTTAHYFTPSGRCIHRRPGEEGGGIRPDIEVQLTVEEQLALYLYRRDQEVVGEVAAGGEGEAPAAPFQDRQLQRAADVLRGVLIFEKK